MAGLVEELKRRNVFKVGAAYVVLAWLLAQAADLAADTFAAPDWVMKMLVTLLALLLPLVLFFAWAYELTPEGIKKEKDVDRSQSITHKTGRKLDYTIIGILALALGYFIWESRFEKDVAVSPEATVAVVDEVIPAIAEIQAEAGEGTATEAVATINPKSIAVLPFVNMSEDANNEYFSDGISEEILNALAKVKELKVAGRTSSFAFKGKNQDLRQIGDALGVANILEGSVRKAGGKVRITAQLIQVNDGFHLWSESFDRELTDVFAIQDEIAAAILAQLKAQLLGGESETTVAAARTNSEAYDLYLLARQRLYERKGLSIQSAAGLLDQAIALDSVYAPAYAQRGIATLLLSDESYGTIPRTEAREQGKKYLDTALELDPEQAEAWAGLGLYHYYNPGDHNQAIEALEKALAINPNLIDASNWLRNSFVRAGRIGDARRVLDDMIERDPLYPPAIANAVVSTSERGEFEAAQAIIDRANAYMPGDPLLDQNEANIRFYRGEFALGLPLMERAVALQPDNAVVRSDLGWGLYFSQQYQRLTEIGDPFWRVLALMRLGSVEEAGMLAQEQAGSGNISNLLYFLNASGQSQELVKLVDDRWPDLGLFEAAYPATGLTGYFDMMELAYAYGQVGQEDRLNDALQRMRKAQDKQQAAGANNYWLDLGEASYYAMAGDFEQAIEWFEKAVDRGFIASSRVSEEWPVLKPLEGDPRFEAARLRMMEHLNRERVALGLEPVEA